MIFRAGTLYIRISWGRGRQDGIFLDGVFWMSDFQVSDLRWGVINIILREVDKRDGVVVHLVGISGHSHFLNRLVHQIENVQHAEIHAIFFGVLFWVALLPVLADLSLTRTPAKPPPVVRPVPASATASVTVFASPVVVIPLSASAATGASMPVGLASLGDRLVSRQDAFQATLLHVDIVKVTVAGFISLLGPVRRNKIMTTQHSFKISMFTVIHVYGRGWI